MRKTPLTSKEVWRAIDTYMTRWKDDYPCGLCTAFDPWMDGFPTIMDARDVMRMILATGGKQVRGDEGYFWTHPYDINHEAHEQRMMYLAFLLAWVENP
jgi:hypothetical protein